MNTFKKSIFLLSAVAALASCSGPKAGQSGKSVIVYYSNTGTTEKVAEILRSKTGADTARIVCVEPYSEDFMKTVAEFQDEMKSGNFRAVKPLNVDLANYDTVYLGFPVWFGTYAGPIASFIKANDLKSKTIVPFCTFGSGGNTAVDNLAKALPQSVILPWYGVRTDRIGKAEKEVEAFLVGLGVLPGTKVELPDFSAQRDVTDDEKSVFDAACGSYQMPLGTPVSVASRKLSDATEYLFVSKVVNQDSTEATQQIYVTKPDADGSVPEFTQVVR